MHESVFSDAVFLVAMLVIALFSSLLGCIAREAQTIPRFVQWIRKRPVLGVAIVATLLSLGPITLRSKNGPQSFSRPSAPQTSAPVSALEPSYGVVSVHTNAVSLRAATSKALEQTAWRLHGASDTGFWLEAEKPFFMEGTNPVSRVYVSAGGSISVGSTRRPPVGSTLPDGTGATVLCPLRAAVGVVPEANWGLLQTESGQPETGNDGGSRFWHESLPGGGMLLTWENALLDRLPDRRVTMQAELQPTGDFICRYDFKDELVPVPTNFVIGTQAGTNGINALAILCPLPEGAPGGAGWGCLAETIWRVADELVTNGVSLAAILCTNGILRTPATFALEWRNLAPYGDLSLDPDGDGISSHDEIFLYDTDPLVADTDADGIADNVELMAGTDPLDADENGDGVPDGVPAADWAAHPLWATNSVDGANVAVTLNEAIPQGASATLVMGGLCIPLRNPGSWSFAFEPGIAYGYRLVVSRGAAADLSIAAASPGGGLRGGGGTPVWAEGDGGVFDAPSAGGAGKAAVPEITFMWSAPNGTGHSSREGICLHAGDEVLFEPSVAPSEIEGRWVLENLREGDGGYILDVPDSECVYVGNVSLHPDLLRDGALQMTFFAHQCDAELTSPFCSYCGCYAWTDAELHVSSSLLTLNHDNQLDLSILHNFSPNVGYSDVRFEIREPGFSGWQPISGNTWTARIAGTFEVRGHATADGRDVDVGPVVVQVRFPSETEMMEDPAIQFHAASLWAQTLSLCTPTNRHEVGCWILLDTSSDTYSFTTTTIGPPTPNDEDSLINLLPRPPDSPVFPHLSHGSAVYIVGTLHTHTPTVHRAGLPRPVGASGPDVNSSSSLGLPGIVFDYVESGNIPGTIPMGHPQNASSRLYPTGVCPRRNYH